MKVFKPTLVAALLALGTVLAQADQTNLVENIAINLIGLKQGPTTTTRTEVVTSVNALTLGTRQVIQTLGAATGNGFSRNARLVLITPLNGNASSVQVRDGNNKVDVSRYFSLEQVGTSVTSADTNTRNGRSTQTIYSIQHVVLQDANGSANLNLHFDVNGLGLDFSANHAVPGPDNSLNMGVSGNGDSGGAPLVIEGTINISGQTLETVPNSGGSDPT